MLYHASPVSGLKELTPHLSSHQDAYVYGIRSKIAALLFGAPKDDFDLLMDVQDGRAVVFECYPRALEAIYSGKHCSLYTVADSGFLSGQTGWEEELVCPGAVPVLGEEVVEDLYQKILAASAEGDCQIHFYQPTDAYRAFLKEEIGARVADFEISPEHRRQDPRFVRYHNALLEE